jgi:poly(A) polymerase
MFTGPNPALALTLLERTGLLKEVLPEVAAMRGVRQPRRFHPEGDVFRHTRLILEHLKNAPTLLAFSCLLHDVGKPLAFRRGRKIQFRCHDRVGARIAEKILARLRFPNDLRNQIITCIDGHMTFKDVKKMRVSTLKKFLRRATFESELEQHRLDCLASHGDLTNWRFLKKKMSGLTHEELRPAPLVNGHHLLVLGYKEGPLIGKILKSVEEAQLEKKISSKEEAIEWLKKKFKQKS